MKYYLTLNEYNHILKHDPSEIGNIQHLEDLLRILQNKRSIVIVRHNHVDIIKLEFDPEAPNQIKEINL